MEEGTPVITGATGQVGRAMIEALVPRGIRARTRSLVFLSYVGASEQSANRYLATKARAERLLREAGVPVTVFRCTHIVWIPQ
jgi:uncharacterized protein YbjT (DUF2867 family)